MKFKKSASSEAPVEEANNNNLAANAEQISIEEKIVLPMYANNNIKPEMNSDSDSNCESVATYKQSTLARKLSAMNNGLLPFRKKSKSNWSLKVKSSSLRKTGSNFDFGSMFLGDHKHIRHLLKVKQLCGAVHTDNKASGHNLQWTKAMISKPAPFWEGTAVINGEMKELKLSDYKGKYLVFFFYPLDFTFVCPTEILAFNDRVKEFRALGAEVVACSVDSHFTHLAWMNTPRKEGGLGRLDIPLLSDLTHTISKDYGVYLEDNGHTLRGLFIIDDKGVLRQITMNDLPVGRSVDETLRLVQAFQYTDKHGEVCPANWKPGSDTIVPDPKEKMKYFKSHGDEL